MIDDLKATQCRLDAVQSVFIKGSAQYGWDGANNEVTINYTEFSSIYLNEGLILYKGIKDSYKNSEITYNSSERISLSTLIPNLFASSSKDTAILHGL